MLRRVFNYLTELDPAEPHFTNQSYVVHFCKGGALCTEAIHTNGDPLLGLAKSDAGGNVVALMGEVWALEATR